MQLFFETRIFAKIERFRKFEFFFHGDVPFKLEVLWPHVGEGQGHHPGEVPAPPQYRGIRPLIQMAHRQASTQVIRIKIAAKILFWKKS